VVAGDAAGLRLGPAAGDGGTTFTAGVNGGWTLRVRVSDADGEAMADYRIEVAAPAQPALAGRVLDGEAGLELPAGGRAVAVLWRGATVAAVATGPDGRFGVSGLIRPLAEHTLLIMP
jgi:hypothetical protein